MTPLPSVKGLETPPVVYHHVAGSVVCRQAWLSDAACIDHLTFWSERRSEALDTLDKATFEASIILSRQLRSAMDQAAKWKLCANVRPLVREVAA
jgi:hypothetical protein